MMDQQHRPETKNEGAPPPKPKPGGAVRRPEHEEDEGKHSAASGHAAKHDKAHEKHHEGH